jgi:GNAT superfamily N-acetyltransferase
MRRATRADVRTMTSIIDEGIRGYRSFAPPDWQPPQADEAQFGMVERALDSGRAWALLAFAGDEPAGLVSISPDVRADPGTPAPPGSIYLWQMFVRPAWQGTGLARELHERALAEAAARGCDRMILWAASGAAQARRFYEREGWVPTGREQVDERFGLTIVQYERAVSRG